MTAVIEGDHVMYRYIYALNVRSDWLFLVGLHINLTADKNQQESRAVVGKPHVRCRYQYVLKFTAASRGSPLDRLARLSCINLFTFAFFG